VTSWNGITKADVPRLDGHIWVPIDDYTTMAWNMVWSYDKNVPITDEWHANDEARFGRGADDLIPGTFKLKKNLANDFMIDRAVQKTKTFTGIVGINTQDMALQEGMGPICDRSKEHLGTTDKAIIACRQLLLKRWRPSRRQAAARGRSVDLRARAALRCGWFRSEKSGRPNSRRSWSRSSKRRRLRSRRAC